MRDVGTRHYYVEFYVSDQGYEQWINDFTLTVEVAPSQRMIIETLGNDVQLINKENEMTYNNLQY